MSIDYGSVCSGIEAATAAWHPLGLRAAWFAEIEAFPSAVLDHHYPDVPNLGDMTKLAAQVLSGKIKAPAALVGGTPCQAFSVAGMRQGMLDPRGALTIKYVELADAVDHVRTARGDDECIVVWENVPGVLSDKGNAFGCFLGALAGEDCELQPPGNRWQDAGCVYGPKRTIAWRILDAQYFGLAQRRRRVFVVASARRGFDPLEVLFEREGVRRDSAPRRGQGQDVAGTLDARTEGGGFPGSDGAAGGHVVASPKWPRVFGGNNTSGEIEVAPARNACASASGRMDFESEAFVVHGTQDPGITIGLAHAIGRNQGQENAVLTFSCKDHGADAGSLSPTLRAMNHSASHANAGGQVAVCITGDVTHTLKAEGFDGSEDGTGRGQPIVTSNQCLRSGYVPTEELRALRKAVPAADFERWGLGIAQSVGAQEVLQSLMYGGGVRLETLCGSELDDRPPPRQEACAAGFVQYLWEAGCDGCAPQGWQPLEQLARELGAYLPLMPQQNSQAERFLFGLFCASEGVGLLREALSAIQEMGRSTNDEAKPVHASAVRRLTPKEAERLQGFPDDYTLIPWRGKPAAECPDGPRYKAIGNSKAVPVVRWIGRRILEQL